MTITEKQNSKTTRTYQIVGPKPETITGFWDWLVKTGRIESYETS